MPTLLKILYRRKYNFQAEQTQLLKNVTLYVKYVLFLKVEERELNGAL